MNFLTSRKSQDGHTYMDINTYKAGSSLHWNPISGLAWSLYMYVRHHVGLSLVLLQLKYPLALFVKGRDYSGFRVSISSLLKEMQKQLYTNYSILNSY